MQNRQCRLHDQFNQYSSELGILTHRRIHLLDTSLRHSGAIEVLRELCVNPAAPPETARKEMSPRLSDKHVA